MAQGSMPTRPAPAADHDARRHPKSFHRNASGNSSHACCLHDRHTANATTAQPRRARDTAYTAAQSAARTTGSIHASPSPLMARGYRRTSVPRSTAGERGRKRIMSSDVSTNAAKTP